MEVKAIKGLEDVHFGIVTSYMKAAARRHGLLLNSATSTLEIKRVLSSE